MKKLLILMMALIPMAVLIGCAPKEGEPYNGANLFHDGLLAVCDLENYCGYLNQSGKVAIDLKYSHTSVFLYGYAQVSLGDKLGVINTRGKEVIPVRYDHAVHRGDLGVLMYANRILILDSVYEPYHYTDLNGRPIKDTEAYQRMGYEDATLVKKHNYSGSGQFPGYYFERISDGAIVIEDVGYAVKDAYKESNMVCSSSRYDCRLIDENGNHLTEAFYSHPYLAYGDDLYTVMRGSKRGVIDGKGEVIVPFEYDALIVFNEEGVAILRKGTGSKGNLYGLVNLEGDILVEPSYYLGNPQDNHINGFEGTMYHFYNNEKNYLFNLRGELVFESSEWISSWAQSYVITRNVETQRYSVFDATGEPIFTDAAVIRKHDDRLFWMKQTLEDDYANYDTQGNVVFQLPNSDTQFPDILTNHSEETFFLIADHPENLVHIYNSTGDKIASVPDYVSVEIFADGYILLTDPDRQFLFSIIDFSGSTIIDYQYRLFRL